MKKHFWILLVLPVFLLACVWVWRYCSINQYYNAITNNDQIVYSVGDVVPFEQDYIDYQLCADGYAVCVDEFNIINLGELCDLLGIDVSQLNQRPERVALVSITIFNKESTSPGIPLSELELFGIDELLFIDYELLDLLNPVLEGKSGIALADGTEYNVILPYGLYKDGFNNVTWQNMEQYRMFLQVTTHPTKKVVELQ